MKRLFTYLGLSMFFLILYFGGTSGPAIHKDDPFAIPSINHICGSESRAWRIPYSLDLPHVAQIPGSDNTDSLVHFLQNKADDLSWRTFIAINWPTFRDGTVDSTVCFAGKKGISVWEYWMPSTEIYVDPGEEASPWRSGKYWNGRPKNGGHRSEMRILAKNADGEILNPEDFPVVDRHKRYTLYEVFYNKSAYDYVVSSGLNTKAGQAKFTSEWPSYTNGLVYVQNGDSINIEKRFQRAYFPVGNFKDSTIRPNDTTSYIFSIGEGAIIIKSAWLVLGKHDDASTFHTREVKLANGEKYTMGLVALHIAHKVAEATQWVWSSFEHIRVAPQLGEDGLAILEPGVDYLYFDENNHDPSTYNQKPDAVYQPNPDERRSSQVVNIIKIQQSTALLNEKYHKMIREANPKSEWLNYRLVGTQWPLVTDLFTSGGEYQPAKLANSLMETYRQGSSNCMGCHSNARFGEMPGRNGPAYNADFIIGLSSAR